MMTNNLITGKSIALAKLDDAGGVVRTITPVKTIDIIAKSVEIPKPPVIDKASVYLGLSSTKLVPKIDIVGLPIDIFDEYIPYTPPITEPMVPTPTYSEKLTMILDRYAAELEDSNSYEYSFFASWESIGDEYVLNLLDYINHLYEDKVSIYDYREYLDFNNLEMTSDFAVEYFDSMMDVKYNSAKATYIENLLFKPIGTYGTFSSYIRSRSEVLNNMIALDDIGVYNANPKVKYYQQGYFKSIKEAEDVYWGTINNMTLPAALNSVYDIYDILYNKIRYNVKEVNGVQFRDAEAEPVLLKKLTHKSYFSSNHMYNNMYISIVSEDYKHLSDLEASYYLLKFVEDLYESEYSDTLDISGFASQRVTDILAEKFSMYIYKELLFYRDYIFDFIGVTNPVGSTNLINEVNRCSLAIKNNIIEVLESIKEDSRFEVLYG